MPPLRILHVVPYYEQAWAYGGIPRLATTMTRALARRGHHVTVCTTDACDAALAHCAPHAPDVRPRRRRPHVPQPLEPLAYQLQFFTPIGSAALPATAASRVRHRAPARLPQPAGRRRRIGARRAPACPTSCRRTARRRSIERRIAGQAHLRRHRGRGCLGGAARVLAVSRRRTAAVAPSASPTTRITLLPNPIDEREFEPAPDGSRFRATHGLGDAPLVLLLAQADAAQGRRRSGSAFARLARPDARLVDRRQRHGLGRRHSMRSSGNPAQSVLHRTADRAPSGSTRSPPPTSSSIRRATRSSASCRSKRCSADAGDRLQRQRLRRDHRHGRRRPHRPAGRRRRRWPARSSRCCAANGCGASARATAARASASGSARTSSASSLDALYRDCARARHAREDRTLGVTHAAHRRQLRRAGLQRPALAALRPSTRIDAPARRPAVRDHRRRRRQPRRIAADPRRGRAPPDG